MARPFTDPATVGTRGAAPIEDYGLLGDTRTAALVASNGAIDWMCVPRFDGPPLFGRLVGGSDAGTFRLGPVGRGDRHRGGYRPGTASLETTWRTEHGRLTLREGMVANVAGALMPSTLLVRRLTAEDGPIATAVDFDPRFGERRRRPRPQHRGDILVCDWAATAVAVRCSPPVRVDPGRTTTVVVTPGHPLTVVMAVAAREPLVDVEPETAWAALAADEEWWRLWCDDVDHGLPHRDVAVRSLLTLRLLTYSPSGAPVAAPTTSLPEHLGGSRNWDYRFAWPRDASIGIAAFLGVGKVDEARRFLAWLLHASRLDRPRLPVLFTLHGRRPGREHPLEGWPGYGDSRPVRIGNGAADQHQLDGYGWVLDAAWLLVDAGHHLYAETWRANSCRPLPADHGPSIAPNTPSAATTARSNSVSITSLTRSATAIGPHRSNRHWSAFGSDRKVAERLHQAKHIARRRRIHRRWRIDEDAADQRAELVHRLLKGRPGRRILRRPRAQALGGPPGVIPDDERATVGRQRADVTRRVGEAEPVLMSCSSSTTSPRIGPVACDSVGTVKPGASSLSVGASANVARCSTSTVRMPFFAR